MMEKSERFLRLFVLFDLPAATKKERQLYTKFRKLLINEGFIMLQFSVYCRICKGQDSAKKYTKHIKTNLPPKGNVRILQITEKQYEMMELLVGVSKNEEKVGKKQLVLF